MNTIYAMSINVLQHNCWPVHLEPSVYWLLYYCRKHLRFRRNIDACEYPVSLIFVSVFELQNTVL